MKKIKTGLVIIVILLLLFSLTYIPHKISNIDPTEVSKITIFDGNTGNEIEITHKDDINYIINDLNEVTFQKGKLSFGYMGYSFRTTILDEEGKSMKELIINSSDVIRYNGFFYKSVDNSIDYEYIKRLVEEQER